MGSWLGIDLGSKRIGIAVGDTSSGIATPQSIINAVNEQQDFQRIVEIANEYHVEGIVMGWPLNMDDSEGPQGKLTRETARRLADTTGMDVRMWDERLSSFTADQSLAGMLTRKKKRARQDAVAAACILQDFLASGGPDSAPKP